MSTVVTFDTLAYANKLKAVDIPPAQAEAQAEAMRDILESAIHTAELATKNDVNVAIALVKKDMEAMEQRVNGKIDAVEQRLNTKMDALNAKMDAMMNKLIIRLTGAMIVLATVTGTIVSMSARFGG